MKLKIYLYQRGFDGVKVTTKRPQFVLDIADYKQGTELLSSLFKQVTVGNSQYVMLQQVIFESDLFQYATLA